MKLSRLRTFWNGPSDTAGDGEALITELYRGILGREPDSGGLRSHAAALRSGVALADVARSMISSDEFSQQQKYLRVPPTELPDLTERFPQRYRRNPDGSSTLAVSDDREFDELENAIHEHRYYDSFGVWSPVIDIDKRVTAALVAGLGARRCLELGCFTGPVLSLLDERGIEVTGVEISHLAFVLAYPSIKNRIRYGDLLAQDLPPPYDAVLAMDILEHFNPLKLDRYLERMRALLDRDGYCLINSPMFGRDDVFGDTDIPLPEWRAAGPDTFWRHLHCDARGWPMHGHLVWASPSWWESRFAAHGLVRDREIEHRVHCSLGGFFDKYAPARRTFFVLKRDDNANSPREVAERVAAELAEVLAADPELAGTAKAASPV